VYSVLWGTLLLDYDSEEDAKHSLSPRLISEILGISEWDGQGRANQYVNGFLLVTHKGTTYYLSAPSMEVRDEWILHIRRALECNFGNSEVGPFKPSKIVHESLPPLSTSNICGKTKSIINNLSSAIYCKSCGRPYSSSEYVSETTTMLQLGAEEVEKVCSDCKNSQLIIIWLKTINYMHLMTLHELTPAVVNDIIKFKSSFKLRRQCSSSLDNAAKLLLDEKAISIDEFENLKQLDHDYRRDVMYDESEKLKQAIDVIGHDMQTLINLLLNPAATEKGGRLAYFVVIVKIMEIADSSPDLIDFYWPQLIHVLHLETQKRTIASMIKVDLLQQLLLVISKKYPQLGLKLTWSLLAVSTDYAERKVSQVQYAASIALLLQLDYVMSDSIISAIADVPTCKVLSSVLRAASHQKQELGIELSVLFLTRRRLQEIHDEEDKLREKRVSKLKANPVVISGEVTSPEVQSILSSNQYTPKAIRKHMSTPNSASTSATTPTCLQLLNSLGVGEATPSDRDRDSTTENTTTIDDPPHQNSWAGFGDQLDFICNLTDIVDNLRFVDRAVRSDTLRREIAKFNNQDSSGTKFSLGWDPTSSAGEPAYRITKIFVEECKVFRTKARAPSLILCEVLREDWDEVSSDNILNDTSSYHASPHHIRTFSSDVEDAELQDVDSLVNSSISKAIHEMQVSKTVNQSTNLNEGDYEISSPVYVSSSSTPESGNDNIRDSRASRAIKRVTSGGTNFMMDNNTRSSLLSANRKTKNFQSILSTANSTSEDDLQLLSHDSNNATPSGNSTVNDETSNITPLAYPDDSSELSSSPSPAHVTKEVYQRAKKLLDSGQIDQKEFELLIMGDSKYRVESKKEKEEEVMSKVESAFGEPWAIKKDRLLGDKVHAINEDNNLGDTSLMSSSAFPVWDLRCFIVKSNDDLRQEVCCLQLMNLCQEIFVDCGLANQLVLKPYRIVSTSSNTGIVEVLKDTMSLDGLKKTNGFTTLAAYFKTVYGASAETLNRAKRNFAASLAAYSLFTYILMVKDRHNGNILIDTDGHVIHIDFGFLLSIAPGGSFSLETAPFKLTEEMVEVLGGLESQLFGQFVKSFTSGFLALRANAENIISSLQVLSVNSPFPCFNGKDSVVIMEKLKQRFRCDLGVKETVQHCLDLIIASYGHLGTRQYDMFQWATNGIAQ
jgi:phosphatidylinositol 4-kinase